MDTALRDVERLADDVGHDLLVRGSAPHEATDEYGCYQQAVRPHLHPKTPEAPCAQDLSKSGLGPQGRRDRVDRERGNSLRQDSLDDRRVSS